MRRREMMTVFCAMGITFALHAFLQWYSWALADGMGHRHPLPFFFLSFPLLWFAPRSLDSIQPWMALNSAIWAGIVRFLIVGAQHHKRTHRSVSNE